MLTFEEIKEVLSNFQKVDNVNPGDRRVFHFNISNFILENNVYGSEHLERSASLV